MAYLKFKGDYLVAAVEKYNYMVKFVNRVVPGLLVLLDGAKHQCGGGLGKRDKEAAAKILQDSQVRAYLSNDTYSITLMADCHSLDSERSCEYMQVAITLATREWDNMATTGLSKFWTATDRYKPLLEVGVHELSTKMALIKGLNTEIRKLSEEKNRHEWTIAPFINH